MADVDWSQLYKHRRSVKNTWPKIWSLPVAKRYSSVLMQGDLQPTSVLEIGAGERALRKKIQKRWPTCNYASFDVDKHGDHDFYDLDEINGRYDLVCMFEVIEHVTVDIAHDILEKAYDVLAPGGTLMITTPNIYYPPGYLRDATHITPWCYDELGGIASLAGFRVKKIYRLYNESWIQRLIRRVLCYPLFRLLGIDYSRQIMLVAQKPSP